MAGALFWLSDAAWAAIEPHLPKNQPGARRVDDRRVISGIVHMLILHLVSARMTEELFCEKRLLLAERRDDTNGRRFILIEKIEKAF